MNQVQHSVVPSGDSFTYRLEADGVCLVGCKAAADELIIPASLDGRPVVAIGEEAFARNFQLTSVELPEGLLRIGPGAFKSCVRLHTINLPSTLQSAGSEAFCTTIIERFDIPQGCVEVNEDSFYLHSNRQYASAAIKPSTLEVITVAEGNTALTMEGGMLCLRKGGDLLAIQCPAGSKHVSLTAVTGVSTFAFMGIPQLSSVEIADSVKAVGRGVVFPHTTCDALTVTKRGATALSLAMPSEECGRLTLASLFRGPRVDAARAAEAFDTYVVTFEDKLTRSKVMLERLASRQLVTSAIRQQFLSFLRPALESICLHFGTQGYWLGFDHLFECGLITTENVAYLVDILIRFDQAAAAGYLIQSKRRRWGKAVWDYDL